MNERVILSKINREKADRRSRAELKHYGFAALFFFLALLLFGCSAKEQVVYKQNIKEVYIPVKCNIDMPVKPAPAGDTVKDNINIVAYSKEVEQALKACIRGGQW